ncbi:hypothetical protein C8R48DRAFT_668290 [Suillus tomentosus]|nr:hypothetical protein C8R48DRAFT_668290 [Suillus tomentosus]
MSVARGKGRHIGKEGHTNVTDLLEKLRPRIKRTRSLLCLTVPEITIGTKGGWRRDLSVMHDGSHGPSWKPTSNEKNKVWADRTQWSKNHCINSQVQPINRNSSGSPVMSFRQPREPSLQPSWLHQPTHPQRFSNQNTSTTLHQPTQSTWRSTSTSLPRLVGAGATQETPPSSHSMSIRNECDFSLALSIRAAEADTRECPWYGVWAKVLQNYMFAGADASRTSCTCVPQYSLIASHDSGRSPPSGGSGRSDSDISMGSHSSDRHLMTPGGPLPGPPPVPYNPTPNFSPQSQAIFGGPLPPLHQAIDCSMTKN